MKMTLAFDVYGTLIDTNGVILTLQNMVGDRAAEFSRVWREKQLEYSFRRGLMRRYRDFSECTQDALNFTCEVLQLNLVETDRRMLIDAYRVLPAFGDVQEALAMLNERDYRLYAFSNGQSEAVSSLLEHAGILHHFIDVVSVDEIQSFKPNPDVYHHLLERCDAEAGNTWLISSNPFDVMGARSAGLMAAWLQRSPSNVYDPWNELAPDVCIQLLTRLDTAISEQN